MDNTIGTIAGTLRAWLRLTGLLVITVVTIVRLKVRRLVAGNDPHTTASFGQTWAKLLIGSLGVRLTVKGRPQDGTVLYLANHRSYIDIAAILSQVQCAFLAKKEVGEWPVLGYATRLANTVFVDRNCKASRRASREGALNILRQGLPFAAFPEGTTSKADGVLPFYNGMFEVAAQHGYTVVPVAIEYADRDDAWVDQDPFAGHFLDRMRKPELRVTISFGPALRSANAQELKSKTREWILGQLTDASTVSETEFDGLPVYSPEFAGGGLPMVA